MTASTTPAITTQTTSRSQSCLSFDQSPTAPSLTSSTVPAAYSSTGGAARFGRWRCGLCYRSPRYLRAATLGRKLRKSLPCRAYLLNVAPRRYCTSRRSFRTHTRGFIAAPSWPTTMAGPNFRTNLAYGKRMFSRRSDSRSDSDGAEPEPDRMNTRPLCHSCRFTSLWPRACAGPEHLLGRVL